ncbi:MAG: HEPN domain-containing protein [Candidatus Hodarchaeota archaeon]
MRNLEIVRYKRKLDHLFQQVELLSDQIELQSHWARYLCILVSGFLETATRAILAKYARDTASPKVANYVEGKLREFQNPKMGKILELIRLFSPEWEAVIAKQIEGELKDAVDSIVANRNKISHGEDVSITFARIQRYYQDAIRVIDLFESQCN